MSCELKCNIRVHRHTCTLHVESRNLWNSNKFVCVCIYIYIEYWGVLLDRIPNSIVNAFFSLVAVTTSAAAVLLSLFFFCSCGCLFDILYCRYCRCSFSMPFDAFINSCSAPFTHSLWMLFSVQRLLHFSSSFHRCHFRSQSRCCFFNLLRAF